MELNRLDNIEKAIEEIIKLSQTQENAYEKLSISIQDMAKVVMKLNDRICVIESALVSQGILEVVDDSDDF